MNQQDARLARAGRAEPGVPIIPMVNRVGLITLYLKEVRRFFKIQLQTIWAPAVNTMLFLAIFSVALGRGDRVVMGVHYNDFLAPGLIVMGMIQNAFANSSSSLLVGKVQGTLVDVLMPPLSSGELLLSYVAGAVTRAWAVGIATFIAMLLWPDVHLTVRHPLAIFYFGTMGAVLLALMGVLTGLWADKFDHAAAVTNFVVQPLTLLSGTFYTLDRLAGHWQAVSLANPFFYTIDGFRYGFIGRSDGSVGFGALALLLIDGALAVLTYRLLKAGWKIKA